MSRNLIQHCSLGNRLLIALVAGALLMGPAGCSLFVDSKQQVMIEANDPDARLFVNGGEVGTGRAVVYLPRNRAHAVRAEGGEGQVAQGRLSREISTTGVLDIIGGCIFLVPFIGAATPGFWQLSRGHVFLDLQANPEAKAP